MAILASTMVIPLPSAWQLKLWQRYTYLANLSASGRRNTENGNTFPISAAQKSDNYRLEVELLQAPISQNLFILRMLYTLVTSQQTPMITHYFQ